MSENVLPLMPKPHIEMPYENNNQENQQTTDKWNTKHRIIQNLQLPDFLNIILGVIVFILFLLVHEYIFPYPPVNIGFYCGDPSLSYPYKSSTITVNMSMAFSFFIIPILTVIMTEISRTKSLKETLWNMVCFYLIILLHANFALVLCKFPKYLVAEHRPHFFALCDPDSAQNCTKGTYVETFKCRNLGKFGKITADELSRSFPSIHAGMSTFTAIFCGYFIHIRIPSSKTGIMFKHVLCTFLMLWSLLNAVTRFTDNRHHWWDVVGGIAIGVSFGIYSALTFNRRFSPKKLIFLENESRTKSVELV